MNGVLVWTEDQAIAQQARGQGLETRSWKLEAGSCELPFERCLIVGPGVAVPWYLVAAGFRNLERWEAAAPLVDGVLAEDIGKASERRLTAEVVRDLRVPVYACELLFVRDCEAGRALVEAWSVEASFDSGLRPSAQDAAPRNDRGAVRLAFLRALYRVKPRFLALPRSWLRAAPVGTQPTVRRMAQAPTALVHVEIAPGRYVCCLPGEEEKYRERFARMRAGRR